MDKGPYKINVGQVIYKGVQYIHIPNHSALKAILEEREIKNNFGQNCIRLLKNNI